MKTLSFLKILQIFFTCLILLEPLVASASSETAALSLENCACDRTRDSLALVTLYNATSGPSLWRNKWTLTEPIDNWHGVYLEGTNCVRNLLLNYNNLTGQIPPEIGNLSELIRIDLGSNPLSGGIPNELGNLMQLQVLRMGGNYMMGGTLPPSLGNLSQLREIWIWGCNIQGSIPSSYSALDSLRVLLLPSNQLSGDLPEWIAHLPELTYVNLSDNKLTGEIPATFGTMPKIAYLLLSFNQLTGSIPSELGNLNALKELLLSNNNLQGAIPASLGDLDELTRLHVQWNQLSGEIPSNLGTLPLLNELWLQFNQLSGSVPPSFGGLTNLRELLLEHNRLEGSLPAELGSLSQLQHLNVCCQKIGLTGDIPTSFSNLTNLYYLKLDQNNLTGGIPTGLNNLTQLRELQLQFNQLSGEIPGGLDNLANLEILNLSFNQLTGNIPAELGNFSALRILNLANNLLDGSIPSNLGSLLSLSQLRLQSNRLSGAIPPQITNLTNLTNLNLGRNKLTGTIPSGLDDLILLVELDISYNYLNGIIPSTLGSLVGLNTLALNNNDLDGGIPSLATLSNLQDLNLSNNRLSGPVPGNLQISIRNLWLNDNELTGDIPSQMGNLSNLHTLRLNNNALSGGIPASFTSLTAIKWLYLNNAGLSGELPQGFENLHNLQILSLHDNQFEGELPLSFVGLTGLHDIYLQNNQFSGCIPVDYFALCGRNVVLSGNPLLIAGDNFTLFCQDGGGSCSENFECNTAIELPLNEDPCDRDYRAVKLYQASTSSPAPALDCSVTFAGNDVWFSVRVPSSGNFLVKNDSLSTITTVLEAYEGHCGNLVPIACAEVDSIPYVLTIENQPPGSVVYIRAWDQYNTLLTADTNAVVALSAHQLSSDKAQWELCDFPVASLADTLSRGAGNRIASQFIVQYDSTATSTQIGDLTSELENEGAVLVKECPCNDQPLQLWTSVNPIELEVERRVATSKSEVDTSNYNYIIENREIQGSAFTAGMQEATTVGIDASGNFVLGWQDNGRDRERLGVFAQRFAPNGSRDGADFQVNTNINFNQDNPKISMQANGDFIVVWSDGDNTRQVKGQLYHSDGSKNGQELDLSDPQLGYKPAVGMDAYGNFVTTWEAPDGSGFGIYGQRYNADGERIGELFFVNEYNTFSVQLEPAIAVTESGAFTIVWESYLHDGSGFGIFARNYGPDGVSLNGPYQVNTFTSGDQRFPSVATNSNGAFAVVWQSYGQDGSGEGIYAQRFTANNEPIGGEILVNTETNNTQSKPVIAMYPDGGFIVVWESFGQDGSGAGIYGQLFTPDGNKLGPELQINTYTMGAQLRPAIDMNAVGDIIISWESYAQDGSVQGVFAQRYQTQGSGASRLINPIDDPNQAAGLGLVQWYADQTYSPSSPQDTVQVAIMDTGVKSDHPEIANGIWTNPEVQDTDNCLLGDLIGYDFVEDNGEPNDNEGHGTGVNGMVVRDFPSEVQLELVNLKFYENQRGTIFDAICAVYYAVEQGVDVLNLSWGFESEEFPQILYDALKYASDQGLLIITSAGNTGKDNDLINKYPANFDLENMLVVTAYQIDKDSTNIRLANYASYGANMVDLAAPGYVETTTLGDSLDTFVGTSLAAPAVARTAAAIKGLNPLLSAADIKDCIMSTLEQVDGLDTLVAGGGILDHQAALQCALDKSAQVSLLNPAQVVNSEEVKQSFSGPSHSLQVFPNPFSDRTKVQFYHSQGAAVVDISLHDFNGKILRQTSFATQPGWNDYWLWSKALPSGIYFIRVSGPDGVQMAKVVLEKEQ